MADRSHGSHDGMSGTLPVVSAGPVLVLEAITAATTTTPFSPTHLTAHTYNNVVDINSRQRC